MKEFFSLRNLALTGIIFLILIIFLFPVKLNVECKAGGECPTENRFIGFMNISDEPLYVSTNYLYLGAELIVSYLLSYYILYFIGRRRIK